MPRDLRRSVGLLVAAFWTAGTAGMAGGDLTRWVGYDGNGSGSWHSSGPAPICTSCGSSPVGLPSRSTVTVETQRMQQFLDRMLEEQREEQKKEAARLEDERRLLEEQQRLEEERRRQLERQLEDLRTIQRLQEIQKLLRALSSGRSRQQYTLKARISDALPVFERQQRAAAARDVSHLRRLASSIDRIHVPPPPVPPRFNSVLFLGWFNTQQDVLVAEVLDRANPFTGRRYDKVFAFGSTSLVRELARAPLDHLLGDFNHLSESSLSRVGELKGAIIEEVVAHSNGAKIAEVLIGTGAIRGVKRLRILGGDAALMNLDRLARLAHEKGIALSVHAVQGDPVPLVPVGWQLLELTAQIAPPPISEAATLTRQILGLARARARVPAQVDVHFLPYHAPSNVVDRHQYGTYHRIIEGQRRQGCLDPAGAIAQRCKVGS